MWKTHNTQGLELENVQTNIQTGEDTITMEKVDASTLEKLRTSVKIDITPKGAFDKYAQELSLENLSQTQNFMNTAWLEDFASLLDPDSVMPKLKIEDLIKRRKEQQEQIRKIQEVGNIIQSRVQQMIDTGEVMPREMQQYMQPTQQPTGDI